MTPRGSRSRRARPSRPRPGAGGRPPRAGPGPPAPRQSSSRRGRAPRAPRCRRRSRSSPDRLLVDGRVRGEAAHPVLDEPCERPAADEVPLQAVVPDALAVPGEVTDTRRSWCASLQRARLEGARLRDAPAVPLLAGGPGVEERPHQSPARAPPRRRAPRGRERSWRRARRPGAPSRCRGRGRRRIPGSLLAAIATPTPLPHTSTPRSARPDRTASPRRSAWSG